MKRLMYLQTLQQSRLSDMTKLGNFLMSVYFKEMSEGSLDVFYLSSKIVNDTRGKVNSILSKKKEKVIKTVTDPVDVGIYKLFKV